VGTLGTRVALPVRWVKPARMAADSSKTQGSWVRRQNLVFLGPRQDPRLLGPAFEPSTLGSCNRTQ